MFKCFTTHISDKQLKVPNFQSTDPDIATVEPWLSEPQLSGFLNYPVLPLLYQFFINVN